VLQDRALVEQVTRLPNLTRVSLRWVERHRFAIALAEALALVFLWRMVALRWHPALSVDAGNYLTTMQQLFGTDVTGEGLRRPPLVGVALWPLVQLFGPLEATRLLAVAASVLIGVPFYLLCSRFTGKAIALAVSLLFVFSLRYMDAVAWGFLTLVGVGLFTLCFYLIYEVLTAPSLDRRRVFALGLASWALVGTHQMSAFIYVATALAFAAAALILGGQLRRAMLRLLPAALMAVFLSLPFVPIYLGQSSAVGSEMYLTVVHSLDGLRGGWDNLRYFFTADLPLLWAVVALVGLEGVVVLFRRNRVGGTLLLTLFFVPFCLNMLVTGQVGIRSGYFLYLPVWLGFAVGAAALVQAVRDRRGVATGGSISGLGLLALVAVLTIRSGHSGLLEAADWYGYLGAEQVTAIEAADRDAPPGAGVAYPRELGRWAEGLAGRRVYEADQRNVYTRAGQRTETLIGNALLAGDRVTTNGSAFVSDAYVVEDMPMDPAVGIDNGELKHLLYLDDSLIEIEYGAGPALRRVTLADAEFQESVTSVESGAFVDRRTYGLDGLRVVKEVTLPEHGEGLTVVLRVESASSPISRIVVPVQPARDSWPVSVSPQQALFAFKGFTHLRGEWWAGAYVDLFSSEGEAATLTLPEGETTAVAEVKPESPRAYLTLAFTFYGEPAGDGAGLRSFAAEDLIREHGVTFALVDRYPAKPWFGDPLDLATLAWLEGSPYFRPLSEEGNVTAYLVAPAAPDEVSGNP